MSVWKVVQCGLHHHQEDYRRARGKYRKEDRCLQMGPVDEGLQLGHPFDRANLPNVTNCCGNTGFESVS